MHVFKTAIVLALACAGVAFHAWAADDARSLPPIDIANVPAEERFADDDEDKRYFLIGGKTEPGESKKPYRLLVVLPGGDGSADFHPFVCRIWKHALDESYLVVQLVAKEWTPGQAEKIVWPTEKSPWPDMRFSTETFIESVIKDVKKTHPIDKNHITLLAWSSGGPAAYAEALKPETPITGTFVAMSVFKSNQLPNLENAKDRSFYILHSPQDFIPIRMAQEARDQLTENGARAKLQTYEGGHGWRGDVFGMVRTGIEWLGKTHEQN